MKGKGLKERILANRQLNALSMMKKAAKEPFYFDQSDFTYLWPMKRSLLMDRSKGFQWFNIQAIFVGDCKATTISQAVASSYCSDQATNKMVP